MRWIRFYLRKYFLFHFANRKCTPAEIARQRAAAIRAAVIGGCTWLVAV